MSWFRTGGERPSRRRRIASTVVTLAPARAKAVADGLKRLGVPSGDRHYFDLHSILDLKHSLAWNVEVIRPLVEQIPHVARAIAEGALMRLECGRRCFERYREELAHTAETRAA